MIYDTTTVYKPRISHVLFLIFISFTLRAIVFWGYIQHETRFHQADSMDYYNCAWGIMQGHGMHYMNTGEPIFWRVPGYPAYLATVYKCCGIKKYSLKDSDPALLTALWIQLIISSLAPLIILYLALAIVQIPLVAWISAWISAFHLGLVLCAGYLLTEALSVIFFYLFLLFLLRIITTHTHTVTYILLVALNLGIYSWLRPMGEFVSTVTALLLLLCAVHFSLRQRFKYIVYFLLTFYAVIGAWYVRNYQLTHRFFFCPMTGAYLNTFNAPKIIRHQTGQELVPCINLLYREFEKRHAFNMMQLRGTGLVIPKELSCLEVALPIVMAHPFLAMKDWIKEVCKTNFDLYSSQLVAFCNNKYTYDDPEEFLSEKLQLCLYQQKMPLLMRIIVYLELLFMIWLWIGLCGALYWYALKPLWQHGWLALRNPLARACITSALMCAAIMGMTGGFGYARLRLPVEPLMIIFAVLFWFDLIMQRKTHRHGMNTIRQ